MAGLWEFVNIDCYQQDCQIVTEGNTDQWLSVIRIMLRDIQETVMTLLRWETAKKSMINDHKNSGGQDTIIIWSFVISKNQCRNHYCIHRNWGWTLGKKIWNNNSRQSSQCWNLPHILRPGHRHGRVDNQPLHQHSILQSPCPRRWRLCQADCQERGWEAAPETRPVATLKQKITLITVRI